MVNKLTSMLPYMYKCFLSTFGTNHHHATWVRPSLRVKYSCTRHMKTNQRRKLFSNFISLGIIQSANFILPLFVMPYVIRKIGVDSFGSVSVAQVLMIYLSTITDYGFNLTATRDIALNTGDRKKISKIFYTVLLSRLVLVLVVLVFVLGLVLFVPFFRHNYLLYLLGFIYVIGQSSMTNWFFQGMEKMHYITIATLGGRVVFVVLVFIFIKTREDNILFLFLLGIGGLIAGLISIFLAVRIFKLKLQRVSWTDILFELRDGWQITVSNLSINTYLYTNVLVLRIFTNDLTIGYYSIAEKIFFAVRQILGVFSQAVYPRICQLVQKTKQDVTGFLKEIYLPFLGLVFAGCCILFIFSGNIVYFFSGDRAGLPVLLLRILTFVPVIVCLNIPAYQILLALNQKRSYLRVLALGTIVNLLANFLLVNFWGALGTVISITITESFITIGLNRQLFKKNIMNSFKTDTL
jgi:PST family polysaccharide transporter